MGTFYNKKRVADGQLAISTKSLKEFGYLSRRSGVIIWSREGEEIGSIGIKVTVDQTTGTMLVNYNHTDWVTGESEPLLYEVRLVTTACHFGCIRWWFKCPLVVNGGPCWRRVGVLYLVGGYAGCRACYGLTYKSCQDSHKYDRIAKLIGLPSGTYLRRWIMG